jgi:hypothetical protein
MVFVTVFILRFAFLLLFFVSRSDEASRGHVRSALVKGNVPSIIHAPSAGESYHRIEDLMICPAKAVRHALVKLEDLNRKKPSSQLLINSI